MKLIYKSDFCKNENWEEKINKSGFSGSSGFCLNDKNEICIVLAEDKDYWTLVGGGRENNETPLETFIREVNEEAQADPVLIKFFQIINANYFEGDEVTKITNQEIVLPGIRFICKLENIKDFIPNQNGFEIIERKFVSVEGLPNYIPWLQDSENGRESLEILKKMLN